MTAGSWNAQRLEHKPRQQLPADRGSLDRGLLPTFQTPQPRPTRTFDNIKPTSHPLLRASPQSRQARLPDSTDIQHSPQLTTRGVAQQEVTRVGQSGRLRAAGWLGPRRVGSKVMLSLCCALSCAILVYSFTVNDS